MAKTFGLSFDDVDVQMEMKNCLLWPFKMDYIDGEGIVRHGNTFDATKSVRGQMLHLHSGMQRLLRKKNAVASAAMPFGDKVLAAIVRMTGPGILSFVERIVSGKEIGPDRYRVVLEVFDGEFEVMEIDTTPGAGAMRWVKSVISIKDLGSDPVRAILEASDDGHELAHARRWIDCKSDPFGWNPKAKAWKRMPELEGEVLS